MTSVLIVGPSWVGDMVMAQSLLKALRARNPDTVGDVLAPPWSEPLLSRMPEVRRAIPMPVGHGELGLAARYRLGRRLSREGYDQAIVLPNSFKSAVIPFLARVPRRTGYVGECRWGLLNDARRLDKTRLPMTVQRFVALGDAQTDPVERIPAPELRVAPESVAKALGRLSLEAPGGPLLALCPGAEYGPAKRWPAEYFAQIARSRLRQGWQVWLFGSARDNEAAATVEDLAGEGCVNLTGRTELGEAVDLLSLASAVVSNDSGLMHVAAALSRPVVALYGSSDPGFTPPLTEKAEILSLGLSCSPCFQRTCPLGHLNCLRQLPPARVDAAIDRLAALPCVS